MDMDECPHNLERETLMQIAHPQIFKNTAQKSPKDAISTENYFVSGGVRLQIKTQAVGIRVSSEKCEIEGALLGMEMTIQYMKETNTKGVAECVYIFCDCRRAIDILVRQGWLGRHPEIFERVLGM